MNTTNVLSCGTAVRRRLLKHPLTGHIIVGSPHRGLCCRKIPHGCGRTPQYACLSHKNSQTTTTIYCPRWAASTCSNNNTSRHWAIQRANTQQRHLLYMLGTVRHQDMGTQPPTDVAARRAYATSKLYTATAGNASHLVLSPLPCAHITLCTTLNNYHAIQLALAVHRTRISRSRAHRQQAHQLTAAHLIRTRCILTAIMAAH